MLRERLLAELVAGQALAGRMRELAQQAGGPQDLRRAPVEAGATASPPNKLNQRDLDQLRRQVDQLGGTAGKATTTVTALLDEQQLRTDMPQPQRLRESGFHAAWRTQQAALDTEGQQLQAERHRTLEHETRLRAAARQSAHRARPEGGSGEWPTTSSKPVANGIRTDHNAAATRPMCKRCSAVAPRTNWRQG